MVQQLDVNIAEVGARRKHRGGRPQKYILDDRGRQLLIAKYDRSSAAIDELVQTLHVPRRTIIKWAQQLGLTKPKEGHWTEEEDTYIERNMHRSSVANIAKKLNRTKTAVTLRAHRLGINKCLQEGYTLSALCMAFGCSQAKVSRWIELGWLKGKRRHTERERDVWYFTDHNVRHFVMHHPGEIDQHKVDFIWLIDVLTGDANTGLGSLARDYAKSEK